MVSEDLEETMQANERQLAEHHTDELTKIISYNQHRVLPQQAKEIHSFKVTEKENKCKVKYSTDCTDLHKHKETNWSRSD